jgi:hypothetical protein
MKKGLAARSTNGSEGGGQYVAGQIMLPDKEEPTSPGPAW